MRTLITAIIVACASCQGSHDVPDAKPMPETPRLCADLGCAAPSSCSPEGCCVCEVYREPVVCVVDPAARPACADDPR